MTKKATWLSVPGAQPAKGGIATVQFPTRKRPLQVPVRTHYIRHISPHRQAESREDAKLLALWWPTNRYCVLYPKELATDRHHTRGRAGKLLTMVRLWVPLCRRGHQWVERNRNLARAIGLLCPAGRWNSRPDEREVELHEYRLAVYRWLSGTQELLKPGPLVTPLAAMDILREVMENFPAVRATL